MLGHDIGIRHYAGTEDTITRWVDVADRGGHFTAMEEPALLTDDIRYAVLLRAINGALHGQHPGAAALITR